MYVRDTGLCSFNAYFYWLWFLPSFLLNLIFTLLWLSDAGLHFYWIWFLPYFDSVMLVFIFIESDFYLTLTLWCWSSFLLNLIFTLLWLSDAGLHFYWIWFLPYFDSLILVFILLLIFIDSYFNSITQGLHKMLESALKSCSKCWRFFNAHLTVLWTHQLSKGLN